MVNVLFLFSFWIFACSLFQCELISWSDKTLFVCNDLSSRGMNSWWLVVAAVCLRVRGSPELWHTSYSLQWERRKRWREEVCAQGWGRRGWPKRRRRRRDVWLTDLGERWLILQGCTNDKCLFYKKRWGILRRREEAGVFKTVEDICTKFTDNFRLPFPIFPHVFFCFCFFWLRHKGYNLRNTACIMYQTSSIPPPHQRWSESVILLSCVTLTETSELSSSWNLARETCSFFSSFLKSCWCQSFEVLLWFVLADWTELLPQPYSPFPQFTSMAVRNSGLTFNLSSFSHFIDVSLSYPA